MSAYTGRARLASSASPIAAAVGVGFALGFFVLLACWLPTLHLPR